MKIVENIKDNTLLVVPITIKKELIKEISKQDKFLNIKYISFEELEQKLFSYDKEAILYLMQKYNYKYEVAIVYLNSMRYLENKDYHNQKLNNLLTIKKELLEQKLITINNLDYILYENITIYGYTYLTNYQQKIINTLKSKHKVNIIEEPIEEYKHKIYEFINIKDEIVYIATEITKLLINKVNINNIKLIVEDKSYYDQINFIFSLFNLNTSIRKEISLDISPIGKYFLENLDDDVTKTIELIKNNFDLDKKNNLLVYNELVKIINSYNDKKIIKDMIKYDLKRNKIKDEPYQEEIKIISLFDSLIKEENYVFLLGFNQKIIPHIYKDEEFLTDKELELLNIETSHQKNSVTEKAIIKRIKQIKNLIITYKLYDNNDSYLISNLNDLLNYEIIKNNHIDYKYSNKYNELKLAMSLDKLVKYNVYDDSIDKLYNTYSNINYLSYDNSYLQIAPKKLSKYINNKLLLSYTALNNYYECAFKYYLSNILKLLPYTKTYMTIIGEVFHYVLSKAFSSNFDFDLEYDNFLKNIDYEFNEKEKFFLTKLKKDLEFIISTIKKQYKHTTFDKALYEEKVLIEKNIDDLSVTFMGVIDKLMYKETDKEILMSIIDYKTGSTDINLSNIIYGLDMQLPIYLYLANNIDNIKEKKIVGFYLQKLLHPIINKDYKKTKLALEEANLKLNGYSISNQKLLEEFDDSYIKSEVIGSMSTTKDGSFSHYAKVLEEKEIKKLEEIVEKNIETAILNIKNAKFEINPKIIGNDNKSCKYCQFYDICFKQNKDLVKLKEIKLEEILKEVE